MFQLFLILSAALIIKKVHLGYKHFSYSIYLITISIGVSLVFGVPADSWSGGNAKGFMGAFHHQNSLGAIILFLLPILNFSLFENYKKFHAAKLASLIAISLFLLITLFLTASRAAILSYLIFLLVFYSFINIKKTILALVSVVIIVSISLQFAPTSDYLHNLIYKGRDQFGASRFLVYKTSLQAASNGGAIGFGFNMSDPDNIHTEIGITKNGFYQREKGSTALALIEETGVIGFILYFIAIAYLLIEMLIQIFKYKYIYRDIKHRYKNIHEYRTNIKSNFSIPHVFLSQIANLPKSLYKLTESENRQSPHKRPITKIFSFAFLTALIIHQQFEAYGVAVGSQFYLFFLLLLFK
jgi:O-antigen ligase